jgi:hypothetical protein
MKSPIWGALIKIPIIGGTRIITRKIMTAERYRVYFKGFLEDKAFSVFHSLLSKVPLLSLSVFFAQKDT